MLSSLRQTVARFLKQEEGPTSLEYAVILGVIVVIGITAVFSLRNNTSENATVPKDTAQSKKISR